MSKHFPIKTLIGLAQDDVDAAAQRLGRAQREHSDLQRQLDSLVQYRNEYHAGFSSTAQAGMSAGNLLNFQAFIGTLDQAIEKQRQLLDAATKRVEVAKPEWQRQKQKLGSYEVLQSRAEATHARTLARREQRDADEHAARAFRMRAEAV